MSGAGERFCRDGRFAVDGVGLAEITRGGTPAYVYSAGTVRGQYRRLAGAFPEFRVLYSLKANPNPAVCRLLRSAGAGGEVSSLAELETALEAGISPRDIVLVGPAKTDAEIEQAVGAGIAAIVVDCVEDITRVDEAAARLGRDASMLCRINTRERPEAREVMVGGPGKFGFDEEDIVEALRGVRPSRARVAGIQVYSASQVLDSRFLEEHIGYVLDLARRLAGEAGFELETIDFGGGFGIPYSDADRELDVDRVGAAAARLLEAAGMPAGCQLLLESGRYIVGPAGVFLTRVERVKRSRGRSIVITDGGINAFSRPVFMRVAHRALVLDRPGEAPTGEFDICGPICTPLDCLGRDVPLAAPRPGDTLGFFDAGAYGRTMSLLGFMSRGAPAELLADDGRLTSVPGRVA